MRVWKEIIQYSNDIQNANIQQDVCEAHPQKKNNVIACRNFESNVPASQNSDSNKAASLRYFAESKVFFGELFRVKLEYLED